MWATWDPNITRRHVYDAFVSLSITSPFPSRSSCFPFCNLTCWHFHWGRKCKERKKKEWEARQRKICKEALGFEIPIPPFSKSSVRLSVSVPSLSVSFVHLSIRLTIFPFVWKSESPGVGVLRLGYDTCACVQKSSYIPWVGQQGQRWGHIKAKLDLNVRPGRHWPANGQTLKSFKPTSLPPSTMAAAGAYWIGKFNGYNHSIASYNCIITTLGVLYGFDWAKSFTSSRATPRKKHSARTC